MADSSEDEQPLIMRKAKEAAPTATATPLTSVPIVKEEPPSAKKPSAAVDASDSDDDVPLAMSRKTSKPADPKPPAAASSAPGPPVKKEPSPPPAAAPVKKEAVQRPQVKQQGGKKPEVKEEVKEEVKKEVKKPAVVKKQAPAIRQVKKEASASPSPSEGKSVARVKKEYTLPGQTRETPLETDPVRKFYTSLLKQRPESELAKKWCLQHGLLDPDEAHRVATELSKMPNKSPAKRPPAPPPAKRDAKRSPAPKRPIVKHKPQQPEKRPKKTIKYEECDSDGSDDVPLAKRSKPASSKAAGKPVPVKRDVAFADGGLDDSDDDVPLAQQRKAAVA